MAKRKVKIVPDTSILIDRRLSEMIKSGKLKNFEIIIPLAALDELQAQASKGRESGFIGLDEIKVLRELSKKKKFKISFAGERPTLEDIKLARSGRIDAIIRETAKKVGGILYTADYVQALVGEAEGVKVKYIPAEIKLKGLIFEKYLTEDTLSLHLKENSYPFAKRGKPGKWKLVKLEDRKLTREDIENIIREISEAARISDKGYVEISRSGATVIQLGEFRIAITRPPFSDGLEVTIVRPVIKLRLEDYNPSEKLIKRLREKAEGILICGPPGSGKTTLASSLAEFYFRMGKIVKTLESPKDLQVPDEITQYGPLEGDFEKTAEILLLVRPDYSIFDEVRKTRDFKVFTDLRLAGVGMIGVVHASSPIDAIERFMGRLELGMIPHVVDTIIFVEGGKIKKVYELTLTVRVPTGMTEADLARPIVEVRDFETGKLEYEIYTYGEENVIIPIEKVKQESPLKRLAAERILLEIKRYDPKAEVEMISENKAVVRVRNDVIPRLIGKNGENIERIEEKLGIHIEVEPRIPAFGRQIRYEVVDKGGSLEFYFGQKYAGKIATFYVDGEMLFSATIGKKGRIKVSKSSEIGKKLVRALTSKKEIRVVI